MAKELIYEKNPAIRIDHWVRVFAVAALIFTGFYIHWPFISGEGEFLMAWMRFFHFIASYVLIIGLLARGYLVFYSRELRLFVPVFIALLIIFTALTGFALYKGSIFGVINAEENFRWVNTGLGGESYTRIWHLLLMWGFIIFIGIHVYMGIMRSIVNKDNTLMSIFTGYKYKLDKENEN